MTKRVKIKVLSPIAIMILGAVFIGIGALDSVMRGNVSRFRDFSFVGKSAWVLGGTLVVYMIIFYMLLPVYFWIRTDALPWIKNLFK